MKAPLLVGVALAIIILAVCLVAPALRSSAQKNAVLAQQQAALAERELARVSVVMPRLTAPANTADLKKHDAEFSTAISAAAADPNSELARGAREYASDVRAAETLSKRSGLRVPTFPKLTPDAAGVQQALAKFDELARENDKLLASAISDAQRAQTTDGGALGVSQALGMGQYVRACELLDQAQELRTRQAGAQARLLDAASQWKLARGYLDHFQALEVAPILDGLQTDLAEISQLRGEADTRLAGLQKQVAEQEQKVEQAGQALKAAQAELRTLEEKGFTPGNDDSFNAYRQRYAELAQRVRDLQQQEQELHYGGLQGAELVGDNLATAKVEGGTPVVGLVELKRRLADAEERDKRLSGANVSLDQHIRFLNESGTQARGQATHYQEWTTRLETTQKELVAEVEQLAEAAFAKETEALQAAEASARAFKQAQGASDAWLRAARELRQNKDPDRKNERLQKVTADPYLEHIARSAEAAAQVLCGRIQDERVQANQNLIDAMRVLAATNPDFEFNPAKYQEQLDAARAAGIEALSRARDAYTAISEKLANQPTVWAPLASLAVVHHLLAQMDATQAAANESKALETIQKAVEKREQSPYVKPFVPFRDYLRLAGRSPSESKAAKDSKQPTKEKEEDKGGFFLDEEAK